MWTFRLLFLSLTRGTWRNLTECLRLIPGEPVILVRARLEILCQVGDLVGHHHMARGKNGMELGGKSSFVAQAFPSPFQLVKARIYKNCHTDRLEKFNVVWRLVTKEGQWSLVTVLSCLLDLQNTLLYSYFFNLIPLVEPCILANFPASGTPAQHISLLYRPIRHPSPYLLSWCNQVIYLSIITLITRTQRAPSSRHLAALFQTMHCV